MHVKGVFPGTRDGCQRASWLLVLELLPLPRFIPLFFEDYRFNLSTFFFEPDFAALIYVSIIKAYSKGR